MESLTIGTPNSPLTSYQTAPLVDYSPVLVRRAGELFRLVNERVGGRAREYRGSYSVFAASSDATAAKIIVYEIEKGKLNGPNPQLVDGVYVLIRVSGSGSGKTIGVAPKHEERFAYFRLADGLDLEEIADFIAASAASQ